MHLQQQSSYYQGEFRIRCKDGSWKWMLTSSKILAVDKEAKPLRAIGTSVDITSKREAEQNIRFQAQLLDLVDSAIISLTADFSIRTWSMGAEALFKIPARATIGVNLSEVLRIKDYEHFLENSISNKERIKAAWKREAIVVVQHQKTYPVYCTFAPIEGTIGEDEGYLLVCEDIEEISHIQHQLIEQQAYIVSVTENLADSIFALNENFELLYFNTAFRATSKQFATVDLNVGDNLHSLVNERGKKQLEQNWEKVQTGERFTYDYQHTSPDERVYNYEIYINPIYGVKDEITGISYLYRDISEKKRNAEDFQRMQSEILNVQLKEQWIQTEALIEGQELERKRLSRELHDGLGQMLNVLKMQLVRDESSIQARQTVDHIIEEIIRINNNLMPLLLQDFGLEAGIGQLIQQYEKLTDAEFYFFSEIKHKRFNQKFEINVYRIVQEALSNAVKYAKAKTISIQIIPNQDSLLIMIEDDGVGFDLMAEKTQTGKSFGLLNMQFRAEAIHGKIVIETSKGRGCVINVELPVDNQC